MADTIGTEKLPERIKKLLRTDQAVIIENEKMPPYDITIIAGTKAYNILVEKEEQNAEPKK